MSQSQKTVCVIGAGLSGLTSLKCMLDAGFDVICLEKENAIAGRWSADAEHAIPSSTITNLPHFMSGFSDFPVPDDFPLYIPADQYCKYFELYAKKFDLLKHIKVGCNVVEVTQIIDSKESTHNEHFWRVKYVNNGLEIETYFDYIVVCSGFYNEPFVPEKIKTALSTFKGKIMHCIDYKDWKEFEGKKVIVCGLGNSGGDIVAELSRHSSIAYISTARGSHVLGRVCDNGKIPIEMTALRLTNYIPNFIKKYITPYKLSKMANSVYNSSELRLTPITDTSVIVNDEICSRIVSGKIVVKSGISKTFDRTVCFSDGSSLTDVDAIILCTGYKRSFAFFKDDLLEMEYNGKYLPLYKGVFTSKFHRNAAFVGMFSVLGSVVLTSEMQARYAAEVFLGKIKLPETKKMEIAIKEREDSLRANYGNDLKEYNMIMKPWNYYDELADEIGCRPSLWYLWLTDPLLAWHLCTQYSSNEYRLVGPGKWDGARDEIIRKSERMYAFMAGSRKVS